MSPYHAEISRSDNIQTPKRMPNAKGAAETERTLPIPERSCRTLWRLSNRYGKLAEIFSLNRLSAMLPATRSLISICNE